MNLLRIVNKKPDAQKMFTEKYGSHQCALLIREQMMKVHHAALDDTIVTEILKKGTADIDEQYLDTVVKTAKEYTVGIFRRLREHGYDPKLMMLYVVGGGGCLIRNFADYDASRVIINEDICATAKEELTKTNPLGGLLQLVQTPPAQIPAEKENKAETEETVMDFMDSF